MPWLIDLARAARSTGLPVREEPGWQTRGHRAMTTTRGQLTHHTAGPRAGDYPSLRVVRDGRPGLPGPLSHLGLARSGTVVVIAAGLSYHAGKGSWPGLTGNPDMIGIEAESTGDGTDWTPQQRWAYPILCRGLSAWYRIPAALVIAHREWATPRGRKIDPKGIDMTALRAITAGAPAPPAPPTLGGTPVALTPTQDARLTAIDDGIRSILAALSDKGRIGDRTHRTLGAAKRNEEAVKRNEEAVARIAEEVAALAAAPPPDLTGAALDQAIEVLTALRARVP